MSEPAPEAAQVAPEAPSAPPAAPEATPAAPSQDVSTLPEWARESLAKANKEAANYRTQVRDLKPLADKATELQEAQKTEQQRLTERAAAAERERDAASAEAIRFKLAAKHHIDEANFDLLGSGSEEEIEARAAKVAAMQAARNTPPSDRPVEKLRPGATPGEPKTEDDVLYTQIYGKQANNG